ncbi:hypothetical protein MM440_00325 [Arsenicicoccus piscis]|uniref:Transposase IS701-like DDE domain-containing protein n=1 Tax=Arsenicicoccus piscis TaxID=673954 RepID=A0ABQ6HTL4_9MICO|nr:hypothetical protein [Arsenicicoccus piscis]MCH8626274.1 hypothetical protein [Arsenicicoccus piscis]GMA20869.1 hypothetical protein GCM10025862_28900 [Arsenicicoccus piscis]
MFSETTARDLRHRPLTDPTFAREAVDLLVSERSRREGGLTLLACDDLGMLKVPICADECPAEPDRTTRTAMGNLFWAVGGSLGPGATAVAVVGHQGSQVTDADRAWHELLVQVAADTDVRLLHFFVASPGYIHPMPPPLSLAAL